MWETLQEEISHCRQCPRLVRYRETVASQPPPRFTGWSYWGRGVPGFGDPRACLWVVGLAPAAHGANRTGRMFTGDSSGDWLYRALYETGFANQPHSTHKEDGMELRGAYISAAVRCAPPDNHPTSEELQACFSYLFREWQALALSVVVIVPLGHIAYRQVRRLFPGEKAPPFQHGGIWEVGPYTVLCSYHPSLQNTQTRRLKWEAWMAIFQEARNRCIAKKMGDSDL
ncbi:MAG: uracil-DNA glycosylase [Bacteroidia bacterium]|nr:uracil-DNA glycosylase [Bacteroidia bacterium]